ncbi:hypothetical protein KKI24_30685 [bacterium]|nr:hypothetical protein [bacterium]
MKKNQRALLVTTLLALFILAGFVSIGFAWTPWGKKDSDNESGQKANGIFGVKKQSGGDVTVDLTPVSFDDGELIIKISINTHNVDDLSKYDLREIIQLETGAASIKPVKTPRLGGHHNSGRIVFKVAELPDKFSIGITGLNSADKREFNWP